MVKKKQLGAFWKNNFYFEQSGGVLVKSGGVLVVGAIWPVTIDKILHGK